MSAPRITQLVHYRAHGSADGTHPQVCRAAMVTEVTDRDQHGEPNEDYPIVHLVVFNPTGQFFNPCHYDASDNPAGGTWHWPCVEGARYIE